MSSAIDQGDAPEFVECACTFQAWLLLVTSS